MLRVTKSYSRIIRRTYRDAVLSVVLVVRPVSDAPQQIQVWCKKPFETSRDYEMLARQHTGSEDDRFRLGVCFRPPPPSVLSRRPFFSTGAQFRTRGIAFQPGTISVFGSITFPLLPVSFDMLKAHSTRAMLGNGDFLCPGPRQIPLY